MQAKASDLHDNINTAQKESSPLHTSEYILNKRIAVNQT